jgi:hypothetical protein
MSLTKVTFSMIKDGFLNATDFGAVGDGVANDTAALNDFLNSCRSDKKPGFIPAGTYLISAPLDISGVEIEGVFGGFNNSQGTVIKGNGAHILLSQLQTNQGNITYSIKNLRLRDGSVALRMSYAIHCQIENVFVTDCTDGIYCGVSGVLGPLWNNFKNCRVVVSNTALAIDGNDFANANIFDTCYFKGDNVSGSITCQSGIGAVANQFINTEFAGARKGLVFYRTKSTTLDNCYFESIGPAATFENFTLDVEFNGCTFGSLTNDNPEGIPAFLWHKSATSRISVNGGYIYLPSGATRDNLRFLRSDAPASFAVVMTDLPDQEIAATGWQIFESGLPTSNDKLFFASAYTPVWTTTGTSPSLGDGTLSGRYSLSGRICTVQVEFIAGSTTTFGTGPFQFSLPFAALSGGIRPNGSARISDTGTAFYLGTVEISSGSTNAVLYTNATSDLVQNNSPFTFANNDSIRFTITYEI